MSERLKAKIGDDLYSQILEKGIKPNELDLLEGFVPHARLNEVLGKLKASEGKVQEYENLSNEAKKLMSENEELKGQYNTALEKHTLALAAKDKEFSDASKMYLVANALKDSGANYSTLLIKELRDSGRIENISVENGNLLGFKEVLKDLKKEFGGLFAEKTTQPTTPPKNNSTSNNDNLAGSDGDSTDWNARFAQFIL